MITTMSGTGNDMDLVLIDQWWKKSNWYYDLGLWETRLLVLNPHPFEDDH